MSPEGQTSCTLAAPLFALRLEAAEVGGGPHPGRPRHRAAAHDLLSDAGGRMGEAQLCKHQKLEQSRNLCAETREAPGGRGPASQPR